MLHLVDANVLLRLPQRGDPLHATVRQALGTLRARGDAPDRIPPGLGSKREG
jgi:hypothetical protein